MSLTRDRRKRILEQNEGFSRTTNYAAKNFSESRVYTITGGKLYIRSKSKSSWADSRQADEWEASEEETHRFLYENKNSLNLAGIE